MPESAYEKESEAENEVTAGREILKKYTTRIILFSLKLAYCNTR